MKKYKNFKIRCVMIVASIFTFLPMSIVFTEMIFADEANLAGDKVETIFYSNEGKTFKMDTNTHTSVEVAPISGLISNDKTKIAFTKKKADSWYTDPYIYYFDLKTQKQEVLTKTESGKVHSVSSWSPDDKYIVLFNSTQYLGGSIYDIYDVKEQRKITSLNVFTNFNWIDSTNLIYIDPMCKDDENIGCIPTSTNLNKLNLVTLNKENIFKFKDSSMSNFRIKEIFDDGKVEIESKDNKNIEEVIVIDLKEKVKLTSVTRESLFEEKKYKVVKLINNDLAIYSTEYGLSIGSYLKGSIRDIATSVTNISY